MIEPYVAPRGPDGHLLHEGGDRPAARVSPVANSAERAASLTLPISPFVTRAAGGLTALGGPWIVAGG
jgi:hypothetical protein